jgi:DNA-binding transcriptional MerR regulator
MYTVKQLSSLADITVRTLHHYDEIGLLKPSRVGDNGYRYYGDEALYRLQQILIYRELDMPLDDIKKIMGRRDFDVLGALQSHKEALHRQAMRLNRLIQTVDRTIDHLKGVSIMSEKSLFAGFTEEEEEKYTEEAMRTYDPETVKASSRKWKAYTPAEKQKIGTEGEAVYLDLVAAMPKGAGSAAVQAIIARWHRHIQYFWPPKDEQLLALADGYNDDPRFRAFYDRIHPELAAFMREAVKIYVKNRKK